MRSLHKKIPRRKLDQQLPSPQSCLDPLFTRAASSSIATNPFTQHHHTFKSQQWAWTTSSASSPNPANHANRTTAVAATAAEAETKIANTDIITTTTVHTDTETAHGTTSDDTDISDTATETITTAKEGTAKDSAANHPDATRSATRKSKCSIQMVGRTIGWRRRQTLRLRRNKFWM